MVSKDICKQLIKASLKYIKGDEEEHLKIFSENFNSDENVISKFKEGMAEIKSILYKDIDFYLESDPAAESKEEILITYPGFFAICHYRVAHLLRGLGFTIESRIITETAHSKTGIDIHPGAIIDTPFFIDHGTGVVIGETTIIGKRVKIYQGVTLGALSLSKGRALKGTKRHPTIGNDVTIYSGVSILGDIKIGNDVTIGSNAFITESIEDNVKVTIGKPTLILKQK